MEVIHFFEMEVSTRVTKDVKGDDFVATEIVL